MDKEKKGKIFHEVCAFSYFFGLCYFQSLAHTSISWSNILQNYSKIAQLGTFNQHQEMNYWRQIKGTSTAFGIQKRNRLNGKNRIYLSLLV